MESASQTLRNDEREWVELVGDLSRNGWSAEDMRIVTEWGYLIFELRELGFTPEQVRELATSGNGERG